MKGKCGAFLASFHSLKTHHTFHSLFPTPLFLFVLFPFTMERVKGVKRERGKELMLYCRSTTTNLPWPLELAESPRLSASALHVVLRANVRSIGARAVCPTC